MDILRIFLFSCTGLKQYYSTKTSNFHFQKILFPVIVNRNPIKNLSLVSFRVGTPVMKTWAILAICNTEANKRALIVFTILAWTKCRLITKHTLSITNFHSCLFLTFPLKYYSYKKCKIYPTRKIFVSYLNANGYDTILKEHSSKFPKSPNVYF